MHTEGEHTAIFKCPQGIAVATGKIVLYEHLLPYASGFEVLFYIRDLVSSGLVLSLTMIIL
jgi:hypothetical protein